MKIELTGEQIDEVVIEDLKWTYTLCSVPNKIDCSDEYIEPDTEFLKSVEQVLSYYMIPSEFAEWKKSLEVKGV